MSVCIDAGLENRCRTVAAFLRLVGVGTTKHASCVCPGRPCVEAIKLHWLASASGARYSVLFASDIGAG